MLNMLSMLIRSFEWHDLDGQFSEEKSVGRSKTQNKTRKAIPSSRPVQSERFQKSSAYEAVFGSKSTFKQACRPGQISDCSDSIQQAVESS